MHILLVHQAFVALDQAGGTRHHELARYLAEKSQRVTGIASPVSYLTGATLPSNPSNPSSPSTSDMDLEGINVIRTHTYRSLHKSFAQRLIIFISFMADSFFTGLGVRNVDLVWGTSPPIFQGVSAWLLARLKRVPFLFEVRDLWPQFAIAVGVLKNPILIKLSLWLEKFLYRRAERVLVNSPGYVAHVKENGAVNVEVVPNGSDPQMFDPGNDGRAFRSANHLEEKFVVLYAGAHGLSNDLGIALEAAKILHQTKVTVEVRIVFLGDGKEKMALQEQAARLELNNVLFLPPVPKNGMADALAGADACLAILKPLEEFKTTYPNKVFDYMAAGRPVVLAIDGVIREVVETAGCGVFVQPGNPGALAEAIEALAADPGQSRRMGLAGRKTLEEHFSRDRTAERMLNILNDMTHPK